MSEVAENEVAEKKEVVVARVCKGIMPMPLVWFIKFKEEKGQVSAIAKKYFTTPGKISDIQKGDNQKYIVENMRFSAEELDAAAEKVRENFVRGQDEDGNPIDAENKRGTATTTADDAEQSLAIIDEMRGMEFDEDAVTLEQARATYNEANPRAKRAKAVDADTTGEVADAESAELEDESEDDLLDD